ncbi:MAG: LacI family DNA-binding transcriptional regulator, partial [Propionibacteriaceae bacterium]|nr:LacI family DNA-binding transcriptional regulator [Propionibacteriaceae bacterium]
MPRQGQRTPTSHDVARLAGVSQPTVSRALRGDPRITEQTKQKVIEAALKIDYTTDFAARSLVRRSTTIVGIA